MYQVGINKGIILRCTAYQISRTHFVFSNFFFLNLAVYEYNVEENFRVGRPQITTWRMRIASWIPKATNTHSEYVILIAFPLQQ